MPEPITYTPLSKTQQGTEFTASTAAMVIVVWASSEFAGVVIPAEVAVAGGALLGWLLARFRT